MHTRILALALGVGLLAACTDVNAPNLNSPSQSDYTTITDRGQVQNLVTGLISGDRGQIGGELNFGEILGRDAYELTSAEPRNWTELLGPSIDPSGFIGRAVWPYGTIRLADIGIQGISAADAAVLSDADKAASLGVVHTLKALEYLRVVETRDTAGAPIAVDTGSTIVVPDVHCKPDVLNFIAAVLDSGATELAAGGSDFPFTLPAGFADFSKPQTFLQFNRALAAKVNIYRAYMNYGASQTIDQTALTSALAEIDSSYINATDPSKLDFGPAHTYSTVAGDALNGRFADTSTTTVRVNPTVLTDADAGDDRVTRKTAASSAISRGDGAQQISSDHIFVVYMSPTAPQPILPNKELILMKAEILWGQNNMAGALALSNFVRQQDGKLAAVNPTQPADVLTEILKQKRYSLLYESADRWIDARMFGRMADLGQERGFDPIPVLPIPSTEVDARNGSITKVCGS